MEANYIEIIVITRSDGEKTLGIYKFKHEKTAWEHYRRDLQELPPESTFIQLMTIDNFIRSITRKPYNVINKAPKALQKQPRKKPEPRNVKELIEQGILPGIERRK